MISAIIGLGNPGRQYAGTRHNIGFDVVDSLIDRLAAKTLPQTNELILFSALVAGEKLLLAKPLTYMNRSGLAALALLQQYSVRSEEMLVVLDDFNLPLSTLRLRANGSHGGHNGLASLIEELQTEDFPRLRLGIGPAADNMNTADFVLSRFETDQHQPVAKMIETATEAVQFVIKHRLETAMSKYNKPPALPDE